jgi:hypothetical protein
MGNEIICVFVVALSIMLYSSFCNEIRMEGTIEGDKFKEISSS